MLLSIFLALHSFANASLCKNWGPSEFWGQVPNQALEASGLIVSKKFVDRVYHINDGKKVPLIISNKGGKSSREVGIVDVKMKDIEDLAYGQCPDKSNYCIYIADIGDNERSRENVSIIVLKETEFKDFVTPVAVWNLSYPDHPHNAEAMALHPNGELFVITKEKKKGEASSAQVFKTSILNPGQEFKRVGEINLKKFLMNKMSKIISLPA